MAEIKNIRGEIKFGDCYGGPRSERLRLGLGFSSFDEITLDVQVQKNDEEIKWRSIRLTGGLGEVFNQQLSGFTITTFDFADINGDGKTDIFYAGYRTLKWGIKKDGKVEQNMRSYFERTLFNDEIVEIVKRELALPEPITE